MTISFARHQFPPAIIRHAVWLYMRFTLSYRDVEDLLAERGLDISYETVRRWVIESSGRCSPENFGVDACGQRRGGISMRWP
jgi:transposase-like protein